MITRRRHSSIALLALALGFCALAGCAAPTAAPGPNLPAGIDSTLHGTVEVAYVDAAATQIWRDADATLQARAAEQNAIATQISAVQTATAAAQLTAVAAARAQGTAVAADKTATATAQVATQAAADRLTATAVANANATSAVAVALDATARALSGHQTAVAQGIADAAATREVERIAIEAQRQRDTATMYTILTWAAGLGGLGLVALLVVLGYRAFSTWDRRRHFLDQANGESVMWDEIEETLPDGRRVRRRVLINPSRAVGPVIDVERPAPQPSASEQARIASQAQFTRGWIESARAGGGPGAASRAQALPGAAAQLYLPPLRDESERLTNVVVVDGPASAQAAISPRLLTAIERDWEAGDGDE